jgi:hypothetical protein
VDDSRKIYGEEKKNMAYFLGRDVELAITTEHKILGVLVQENASTNVLEPTLVHFGEAGSPVNQFDSSADKLNLFAGPRASIGTNGPWGDQTGNGTLTCTDGSTVLVDDEAWNNEPDNLTALDLSMGVMDEDVAFIGQRNVLKAEVKKENTISITRKKKDAMWDAIYNEARFGIGKSVTAATANSTTGLFDGLRAPDFADCGYRVYIRFKESTTQYAGEVFILRNCYITEHSVSMSADSTQEETMTLMSYTDPLIFDGVNAAHSSGSNAFIVATDSAEL